MMRLIRSPLIPITFGLLALVAFAMFGTITGGTLKFKFVVVALVWIGVIWSAIAGYIYTPNFRIRLTDGNKKEFWSAWTASIGLAALASYFALQLPI